MKKIISFILLLIPLYCLSQGTVIRTAPVSSTISAPNYNKQVVQDANLSVLLTLSIPVVDTPKFNNANPRNGAMILATHDSSIYVFFNGKWRKASPSPIPVSNGLSKTIVGDTVIMGGVINRPTTLDISAGQPIDFFDSSSGSFTEINNNHFFTDYTDGSNESTIFTDAPSGTSISSTDGSVNSTISNSTTGNSSSFIGGSGTFTISNGANNNSLISNDGFALSTISNDPINNSLSIIKPLDTSIMLNNSNGNSLSLKTSLVKSTILNNNTGNSISIHSGSITSTISNTSSQNLLSITNGVKTTTFTENLSVGFILNDGSNFGARYQNDYSANNTSNARWIPDKGYVDGKVAGVDFSHFIYNETPSGTINGSNVTFTLANTPVSGKFSLYKNGLKLKPTTDYTISGNIITYVIAPVSTPSPDILLADYIK